MSRQSLFFIVSAALIGASGAVLAVAGNPANTGICISCFVENTAGALRLHDNILMQYLRPEIVFIIAGSFLSAVVRREFIARTSDALVPAFLGGFFMIVGSAVFMGCPIKMLLRLAGGDLNSVAGIAGLVAGVYGGVAVLRDGVDTRPFTTRTAGSPYSASLVVLGLLVFFFADLAAPGLAARSASGAGAERAPVMLAAGIGLAIGALSQYSRFCVTGSLRNSLILGNAAGFVALAVLTASAFAVNLAAGRFSPGFVGQPGSHDAWFWSFVAMALTGYIAVLIDGCPFRQLVKAGEGDITAQTSFWGMLLGGAAVQNFRMYADAAGPTAEGRLGVLLGIFIFAVITLDLRRRRD